MNKQLLIPASVGELIDKITILEIKQEHATDSNKLKNIVTELSELGRLLTITDPTVVAMMHELKIVNQKIWDIEDAIRKKEHANEFDNDFIELARAVYINNDLRAVIKRQINDNTGSHIIEEKIY
jgi:translation initiation factor 2B subunit (eIF-2B alpha/beta/delta family)